MSKKETTKKKAKHTPKQRGNTHAHRRNLNRLQAGTPAAQRTHRSTGCRSRWPCSGWRGVQQGHGTWRAADGMCGAPARDLMRMRSPGRPLRPAAATLTRVSPSPYANAGRRFDGEWQRGVAQGRGRVVHAGGAAWEGQFEAGRPHGADRRGRRRQEAARHGRRGRGYDDDDFIADTMCCACKGIYYFLPENLFRRYYEKRHLKFDFACFYLKKSMRRIARIQIKMASFFISEPRKIEAKGYKTN
mgnify:CR=1 FL=1